MPGVIGVDMVKGICMAVGTVHAAQRIAVFCWRNVNVASVAACRSVARKTFCTLTMPSHQTATWCPHVGGISP